MKTLFTTLPVLAGLALIPTVAEAGHKVDMAELTCKEFMADSEGIMPTIFWIDGYLSNSTGNTQIDPDQMTKNVKDVVKRCAGNPDEKILDFFQ